MKHVDSMVGGKLKWMGVAAVVLLLGAAGASSAPTCMQFLRVSTLPRVAALGEASTAVRDATWAEANPAHLTGINGSLITFSHTAWFEDILLETLTVGTSSGKQAFGVSVVGLHTDPLDEYDADGRYMGTFRFFDFLASGTYARALSPSLSVGITGKTLYEKIGWDAATGLAFDVGLGYAVPARLLGGLSAGLTMRNLGTKMGYHDELFDLPLSWQGGLSYRPMWLPERVKALVALDYEKTRERDGGILAGLEVGFADMVAVRVGHRGTYEDGDFTVGMGLALANTSVDYAYVDLGEKLGATHRVSLGFRVGGIFPSPEPEPGVTVTRVDRKCDALTRQYEEATGLVEQIESRLKRERVRIEDLKSKISEVDTERSRLEAEMAVLQGEIAKLEGEGEEVGVEAKVPEEAREPDKLWTVKRGETLRIIAGYPEIYGDPEQWMRIYAANKDRIRHPNRIDPGQVLTIPPAAETDEALQLPTSWMVGRGESLHIIAGYTQIYGDRDQWRRIYEANKDKIKDPDHLYPNQVLIIPR